MELKERINKIRSELAEVFAGVEDMDELEEIRVKYLGKKGVVADIFSQMASVPNEEKPEVGKLTNRLKNKIEELYQEKEATLEARLQQQKLKQETVDVTLPGRVHPIGHEHAMTGVLKEIEDVFIGMGFSVAEGPEVESEYYNFEALNIPENHPARDLQDTLYIDDKYLLRTHTSPVQIHTMEQEDPPIRIIAPGRVYRSDELDASHTPVFHQVEGLAVDREISFSDLKGTIEIFVHEVFGENRDVRFRPSYFPFTEPSAEVDVSCAVCGGEGCSTCSGSGWLEIMGSGMVHPNVLEISGYDSRKYSGFAFGMGVERIAMLKYGINDIRILFENDQRFLHQF
ncbi:MAG: phenylalanine--tRNA ligase subunit alpha [Halanaerobiaceae bacterium]